MRRVLASVSALALGVAIVLPTAAAAPQGPSSASAQSSASASAQPSESPAILHGSLKIATTVSGGPGDFSGSFDVLVDCGEGARVRTIAFPDPGSRTISGIEAGAECDVLDVAGSEPPDGYEWDYEHLTISGSPATIVAGETVMVDIVNRLKLIGGASISIMKFVGDDWIDALAVLAGTTVPFHITVVNMGGVTLHDVTIEDDQVALTDTPCADVPDLEPEAEFTCSYTAIAPLGTTVNTATVRSVEAGPESASATVTGYAEWPVLITKTNDAPIGATGRPTVKEGDTVTFTLTYTYKGESPAVGFISDELPAGLTYDTGSATSSAEFMFDFSYTVDGVLYWMADEVTKGGTLTYKAIVDSGAGKLEQPLTNVVTLYLDLSGGNDEADSDVYVVSTVAEETSVPTPPQTDVAATSVPTTTGSAQVILLVLAAIAFGAALIAPTPGSNRKRGIR